jgi:NADPH:quinone reductase-like Zn-dependent oxidoreductase
MRAIVLTQHGGPDVFAVRELEDPAPRPGEVLIEVKAFGVNHADGYMRAGVWPFGIDVLGIECAGVVVEDPSGALAPGTTVVALVGGMARTRNGSYAELVTVPATNVVAIETTLGWPELAAIPEVYATAWVALHDNLALQPGETIVVRGATSGLGHAAVNLAVDHGATVIATTRREERRALLEELGADTVLIDTGAIAPEVRRAHGDGADCLLDLVGNRVLRDSLRAVRPKGRVCQIGFLGGLAPVAGFDPLADLPSGVQLSTFASAFVLGDGHFPLASVPLQDIVDKVAAGVLRAAPSRVFAFDEIADAHRLMDAGEAGGKLVVSLSDSTPTRTT